MKTMILISILSVVISLILYSFAMTERKRNAFGRLKDDFWILSFVVSGLISLVLVISTIGVGIVSIPHEVDKMNAQMQQEIKENGMVFGNPFGEDVAVSLDFGSELKELRTYSSFN